MKDRELRKARRRKRRLATRVVMILIIAMISILAFKRDNIKKMVYSLEYDNYVKTYSEENELDPLFVHSVIFAESNHKPDAISNRGAIGLMQIMPETGYWISAKMGMSDFDESMLKNPETNVEMGIWLLRYLLDEFDDNENNALAAYNAGAGNVNKWLKDPEYSSDGQNLDNIPFKETANYVEKINRAYERYKELYQDKEE